MESRRLLAADICQVAHVGDTYVAGSLCASLGFEPDDHVDEIGADATPIELVPSNGALVGREYGLIEVTGDVDVFQFELAAGDAVSIQLLPVLLESSSLSLFDANGDIVSTMDSPGFLTPASITESLEAGTFYVSVTGTNSSGVGDYTLDLAVGEFEDPDPPTDDHVDTIGPDATEIELVPLNGALNGNEFGIIETSGDVDVFQFEVTQGDDVVIQLLPFVLDTTTLSLLDSDGGLVAEAISPGVFAPATIEAALTSGTYFVSVTGESAAGVGEYTLDVTVGDFDDPDPPTDDHVDEIGPNATPIVLDPFEGALIGGSFGVLETNEDVDVFQFDVAEPDVVSITGMGFLLDSTTLHLIGSDGVVISEVQSDGFFAPAEINESLEAGTYYISMAGVATVGVGDYSIDVRVGEFDSPDPPADDHVDEIGPDATPLVFEDDFGTQLASEYGFLETADDNDVFQFDLEESDLVTISLFQFAIPTATLGLVDVATGVVTEVTATPFENPEASVELKPGTYYLVVNSNEGGVGDYFLNVRVGDPGIPGDDHANTLGPEATDIVFGEFNGGVVGRGSGVIEMPGDVDVFEFEMATDDEIVLSGTHSAPLTVQLLDEDGNSVAVSQSNDGDTYLAQLLDSGTYYVAVSSTDSVSENAYSFDVYVEDADAAVDDHADVIGVGATDLLVDASGSDFAGFGIGTLENSDDIDMFQFSLPAAFDVTLQPLGLGSPVEFDLLDADGNLLAEADDFATAPLTLGEGTYYVSVSGRVGASVPNASFLFLVSGTRAAGTKLIPRHGHVATQSSRAVLPLETNDSSDEEGKIPSELRAWSWLAE